MMICDVYDFVVGDNFVLSTNDVFGWVEWVVLLVLFWLVGCCFVEDEWLVVFVSCRGAFVLVVIETIEWLLLLEFIARFVVVVVLVRGLVVMVMLVLFVWCMVFGLYVLFWNLFFIGCEE